MESRQQEVEGWVKAEGKRLVNGRGEDLILRGTGLGSWLLPEGYMWKLPEGGDRPRRIERMVADLIGEEDAQAFWRTYHDRYTAEADIRQMALEGFNSVRVPFNARMLLEGERNAQGYNEEALKLLDDVIGWCRKWKLYVILDMHGAPGGQTGANIDDSEKDLPELYISPEHRQAAIDMWRMLAGRYRDEWIVAGYDLLNEPLPEYHGQYNGEAEPLYRDMIAAIRQVDERHMIILEGVHWSTDWSIFTEKLDGNVLYQFHKYWNNPDTESIRKYLDFREEWNVPIFMGEGGENDLDWYAGAFRLFEDHGISWNFWTWKKMDTINSPCSVIKPEGWEKLGAYLDGGEKPDVSEARAILNAYLDGLPLEACDYHPEVVNALFRRLPVRIPAIHYGYDGAGRSFGSTGAKEWESGYRKEDGMEIRYLDGRPKLPPTEPGWHRWDTEGGLCLELKDGEWAAYDFTVRGGSGAAERDEVDEAHSADQAEASRYRLKLQAVTLDPAGKALIELDGHPLAELSPGGGWDAAVQDAELPALEEGAHRIVVKARGASLRLEYLLFERI
ncbi:cellulase family glycosylhydrolase [Paenibacillus sp. P22]|uniref:cellulase family glycosylhydrolase n=1 Tax=Paenibacillus sp. P22 TaxID=483908 RepID=UPI000434999F|nr:cellulase family glycosylhydrolase [Paenibacillus sp. P22]CDN41871.1 Glycoside hydrolase family 5 [Paenibacillus sp. P22]